MCFICGIVYIDEQCHMHVIMRVSFKGTCIYSIRDSAMTRLSDTSMKKKYKTSGSYGRLFDDDKIGLVISDVQSTAIRNGNELEKIIECRSNPLKNSEVRDLINEIKSRTIQDGIYLLSKDSYRNTEISVPNHEPDYIIVQANEMNVKITVIEMKDGDDFDTKKSDGELETLTACKDFIEQRFNISTDYALCCFNQKSHCNIVQGLKNRFDESHVMTGEEFCELVNIDYKAILNERKSDATDNVTELVRRLIACDKFVVALESLGYTKIR